MTSRCQFSEVNANCLNTKQKVGLKMTDSVELNHIVISKPLSLSFLG